MGDVHAGADHEGAEGTGSLMALDDVTKRVLEQAKSQFEQQSRMSRYKDDPVLFAQDVLGFHPWSKQIDILRSVEENIHTAVRSCHGSGKSEIASIIACWWVATRPIGEAIVVTTAPTYPQVHNILWEAIRRHHRTAQERYELGLSPMKLPGYITQDDDWKSDTGVLIGFGRKPADSNDHAFQGIHRRFVLVIVDESCGIRPNLFTAVEAITTTENSRILAVGNPDDPAAHFFKFFSSDPTWNRIDVSSFDSPNYTVDHKGHFTDEDREKMGCYDPVNCKERAWAERYERDKDTDPDILPMLPNKTWVELRRAAWGEDSPLWASKVLGEFPKTSLNTLFSLQTMQTGWDTTLVPARDAAIVLGVDLSRFGPDYSTVYKMEDGHLRLVDAWGGKADETKVDGMESASRVHQLALSYGATEVRVDSEGIGGPILDQIVRLSEGMYEVIEMRGSQPSPDRFRWANARAYWYDSLRENMAAGHVDIDIEDTKLSDELQQIQYHFKNRQGALQIESKDDMRKRGLKSPDYSDAAAYAAADLSRTNSPYGLQPGEKFSMDVEDFLSFADEAGWVSPL